MEAKFFREDFRKLRITQNLRIHGNFPNESLDQGKHHIISIYVWVGVGI